MNTKQIRQTILDLAIRGELVPQDPTDEPASVLLERIRAEKEQLIKDKKLKRDKKDNEPIDEVPFELPEGWEWCRLGEVCFFKGGYAFKSNKYIEKSNNQVIRIGNVKNNNLILSNQPVYVPDTLQNEIEDYHIKENDLLFTMTGTKGKRDYFYTLVVPKVKHNLYLNQRVGLLRVILSELNIYFINLVLKHQFVLDSIFQTETGNVNQGNIGSENTLNLLIPIPPLAEQHRIVEKVEQLLTIVNTIEQLQEQLKSDVKQAKNQVLSDAIAGKLTHQDPNDEPAEALLKRIGKTTTTATDTPYEKLPKGWAWCRLGEVCCFENGYAFNSDDYQKNGTPLIRISNIKNGKIDISEAVFIKIEYDKRFMVEYGDLLIAMSGATTGKMGVYKLDREAVLNQRVGNIKIRNKDIFFHKFRNYIMQTKSNEILKMAYGGAQPNISGKMIENLTIPLPPLAEQHRIVQKIETYFSFLDTIENSL